jgi:hypothetical protein
MLQYDLLYSPTLSLPLLLLIVGLKQTPVFNIWCVNIWSKKETLTKGKLVMELFVSDVWAASSLLPY